MERVYKIMPAAEWADAKAAGVYSGSVHDLRDGFIHLSNADEAAATAAKHFAELPGLVLLAIDPALLGVSLKWEPSRGGALFPHLYGSLPVSTVVETHDLPVGADRRHIFPSRF